MYVHVNQGLTLYLKIQSTSETSILSVTSLYSGYAPFIKIKNLCTDTAIIQVTIPVLALHCCTGFIILFIIIS